jgi:hypothetical protein
VVEATVIEIPPAIELEWRSNTWAISARVCCTSDPEGVKTAVRRAGLDSLMSATSTGVL